MARLPIRIIHIHSGRWNATYCGRRVDMSDLAGNTGHLPKTSFIGHPRYCRVCKLARRATIGGKTE
jgi:hypothetical protein